MVAIITQRLMKYTLLAGVILESILIRPGLMRKWKVIYFAYGGNVHSLRFKKDALPFEIIGRAHLVDHQLSFGVPTHILNQGYATVAPAADSVVWGVLYEISRLSLWYLDVLEFVPFGAYKRSQRLVTTPNGHAFTAWVYIGREDQTGLLPSRPYLKAIIAGGKENSFPSEYIRTLEEQQTTTSKVKDFSYSYWNMTKRRNSSVIRKVFYLYKVNDTVRNFLQKYLP